MYWEEWYAVEVVGFDPLLWPPAMLHVLMGRLDKLKWGASPPMKANCPSRRYVCGCGVQQVLPGLQTDMIELFP